MRAIERAVLRANLQVKYSQGFNPRPILSLPCPRPLGIATLDDPIVVSLVDDPDNRISAGDLLDKLNLIAPKGIEFLSAAICEGKPKPQPTKIYYELAGIDNSLADRLAELSEMPEWVIVRKPPPPKRRRDKPGPAKSIDIKQLVEDVSVDGGVLKFTLLFGRGPSARPGEVLGLLGIEITTNLVRLVRMQVHLEPDDKIMQPSDG